MADPLAHAPARIVGMLIAVVVAVVAIGFATGMSPSTYRAKRPPLRERPPANGFPAARTHAELERNPWTGGHEGRGWEASLAIAKRDSEGDDSEAPDVAATLAERTNRRAFDGAPPVVPHPIRASGAAECLACHGEGFVLGNRRAGRIPHDAYASCTQCHVSASAPFARVAKSEAAKATSRWSGLESPIGGAVAYSGAPPAVPHSTQMRERCEACHGDEGVAALRTPHPDRLSCLQCHPATGDRAARASR